MHEVVAEAKRALESLSQTPQGAHIKTGDVRSLSARLFRGVKGSPARAVFDVCTELLEQRSWALGVIAYDFAYRVKSAYDADTFARFEGWLERYVRGWGDCDDFCTHAFGELICQQPQLAERAFARVDREAFWMRRAAAVALIPAIWHDVYPQMQPLRVADALMTDEDDLVRKGYGWMLKVLSTKEPGLVYDYLMRNQTVMPRVSYRYALEKMPADMKKALML